MVAQILESRAWKRRGLEIGDVHAMMIAVYEAGAAKVLTPCRIRCSHGIISAYKLRHRVQQCYCSTVPNQQTKLTCVDVAYFRDADSEATKIAAISQQIKQDARTTAGLQIQIPAALVTAHSLDFR